MTAKLREYVEERPQTRGYEVVEIETTDATTWTRLMLKSRSLLRIPAANIQAVIRSGAEIRVQPGQAVVRQGEPAAEYFIVKHGRFQVTRIDPICGEETELAVLEQGSSFGEDAVISHGRRGATVTALEPGSVIRLSKQDFTHLVVNPALRPISPTEVAALAEQGATLIDVRESDQQRPNGLPNSQSMPLSTLRSRIGQLDRHTEYVLYCDNGHLSAAAAFVLGQHGLRTYLLAGGLNARVRRVAACATL